MSMDDFLLLEQVCWYARSVAVFVSLVLCGCLIYAAWRRKNRTGRLFGALLLCIVLSYVLRAAACFARIMVQHSLAAPLYWLAPVALMYGCNLLVSLFFFGLIALYVQHLRHRDTRWLRRALAAAPVLLIAMLILIYGGYGRDIMQM